MVGYTIPAGAARNVGGEMWISIPGRAGSADVMLGIERVEYCSGSQAICVVRCLSGTVAVGKRLRVVDRESTLPSLETVLTVVEIWRYGKPAAILDAPHTAKVSLSGPVASVDSASRLIGESD